MTNVTISIDEETLARARELASRRGTSLDQIVRDYLAGLSSDQAPEAVVEELGRLWSTSGGNSGGISWTREELHERAGIR